MSNVNNKSHPHAQHVQLPALYLEPSVSTTTVVTTTTTTTTYAPIPLPPLPSTTASPPSDGKEYPLLNARLPPTVREFPLVFPGGKKVFFRDQSEGDEGVMEGSGMSNMGAHAEELASGKGWRMLPRDDSLLSSSQSPPNMTSVVGLSEALEGFSTKKRDRGHEFEFESLAMEDTPARKKARAPPSPLPSPHGSPPPDSQMTSTSAIWHPRSTSDAQNNQTQAPTPPTPFEPDLSMTTLLTLPSLLNHFTALPESLQSHLLLTLLRHSPLPVLRTLHSVLHPTLARDFLTLLPPELVSHILGYLTLQGLGRACRVCKTWRGRIEGDKVLWRDLLVRKGLWFGGETENNFVRMLTRKRQGALIRDDVLPLPHPYKILFKSRYLTLTRWITNPSPKHISFPAHGHSVVTCLLFSQNRIISASDDHSIHVYSPTTGQLLKSLDGHEGGVWALAAHGNLLVSGSTDRTVRIWDLQTGHCLHVFGGHTSTVRCLAIVKPEYIANPDTGKLEKWPKRTVVVTGSRDHTLRVWRLPKRGERQFDSRTPPSPSMQPLHSVRPHPPLPPSSPDLSDPPDPSLNPYHQHLLSGHTHAVRALAARGRTLVSGSYDCTVRVWDIPTGRLLHTLTGHSQKVYSVVLDLRDGTRGSEGWGYGTNHKGATDGRAASGSMDGTVRLWSITTGECLHVLSGHTSLVGLLGLSPSFLVSAAADSTLRVWDARLPTSNDSLNPNVRNSTTNAGTSTSGNSASSGDLLRGVMTGHTGAITCFQHDEWKVVSGSDGTLKVWDLRELGAANTFNTGTSLPGGPTAGGWGAGGAAWGAGGLGGLPGPVGGLGPIGGPAGAGFGGGGLATAGAGAVLGGGAVPVVRDLLTGITGVWQVAFEGRWCVSASNRNDVTVLDVWDFGKTESFEGAGPLDPSSGSRLAEVDETPESRQEGDSSGWTWENEEWVGEPPGGVYDYDDSDSDSDIDQGSAPESVDYDVDRDEDGDIDLVSASGARDDEDDEDIVYTGRRSASSSERQTSSSGPSSSRRRQTTTNPSLTAQGVPRTRRKARAMSEVSRASERSTRSRGSNRQMEVDVEQDIDELPDVPEYPFEEDRGERGYEGTYGEMIERDGEGDERDAEMVEDMMEIDRDSLGPSSTRSSSTQARPQAHRPSHRTLRQAHDDLAEAPTSRNTRSASGSSTSKTRTDSSAPGASGSGAKRVPSGSVPPTRTYASSHSGRRGQGPSSRAADVAEDGFAGDVQGEDGEVRMGSPGVASFSKGSSKRRWP